MWLKVCLLYTSEKKESMGWDKEDALRWSGKSEAGMKTEKTMAGRDRSGFGKATRNWNACQEEEVGGGDQGRLEGCSALEKEDNTASAKQLKVWSLWYNNML